MPMPACTIGIDYATKRCTAVVVRCPDGADTATAGGDYPGLGNVMTDLLEIKKAAASNYN